MDDPIDSSRFSARGYLSLIPKDSFTHMHGLTVYGKEELPFTRDVSLENSEDSLINYVFKRHCFIPFLTSF